MIPAAISYGTYRSNEELWSNVAGLMQLCGYEVHCLTVLPENRPLGKLRGVDKTHCTGGQSLRGYMMSRGILVRTWIADRPDIILGTPAPRNLKEPQSWADLPSTPAGL